MNSKQRKSLDALLDGMAETGEQLISEGHEHAATLFGLELRGEKWCVVEVALVPIADASVKDALAEVMRKIVAPFDAYIYLNEAWMVVAKTKEECEAIIESGTPIKDHPARIESFNLHFVSKLGDQVFRDYEIIRDAKEKTATLGPKRETVNPMDGRFANFYDTDDVAVPRGSA